LTAVVQSDDHAPAAMSRPHAQRSRARSILIRYSAKLTAAYALSLVEVIAIGAALFGRVTGSDSAQFTTGNAVSAAAVVSAGGVVVALASVLNLAPTVRWFAAGRQPTPRQRRSARRIINRQSAILAGTWVGVGALYLVINLDAAMVLSLPTCLAALFAATAAVATGVLFTQRAHRPFAAAGTCAEDSPSRLPSLLTRLTAMWTLCSAAPCAVIVMLIFINQSTQSTRIPVLVVSLVAVLLGVRALVLVARSISDPVREVVAAMKDIQQGRIDTSVDVYEQSEIGDLQAGFNQMAGGLRERARLGELFGRHVGVDVARRAIKDQGQISLDGEVHYAAILFVDMVDSTRLAAANSPEVVAAVLNDFFRIVVDAVDANDGFINKFQGDAALAVFGVPVPIASAATAALKTARKLRDDLQGLSLAGFGIGISAGQVFAGNIGSESRYEYTVIGDVVNEAARLAEVAKSDDQRVVAAGGALDDADSAERRHWTAQGSTVLRGRAKATDLFAPTPCDQ
jgi:adenylate cyclase